MVGKKLENLSVFDSDLQNENKKNSEKVNQFKKYSILIGWVGQRVGN